MSFTRASERVIFDSPNTHVVKVENHLTIEISLFQRGDCDAKTLQYKATLPACRTLVWCIARILAVFKRYATLHTFHFSWCVHEKKITTVATTPKANRSVTDNINE